MLFFNGAFCSDELPSLCSTFHFTRKRRMLMVKCGDKPWITSDGAWKALKYITYLPLRFDVLFLMQDKMINMYEKMALVFNKEKTQCVFA